MHIMHSYYLSCQIHIFKNINHTVSFPYLKIPSGLDFHGILSSEKGEVQNDTYSNISCMQLQTNQYIFYGDRETDT